MDWNSFIQSNFSAIIALVGVLIGLFGSILREFMSKGLELQQKQLDSQKDYREKNLVTPIIVYVDEILQLLDNAYWTAADGGQPNVQENLQKHRDKEGMIKARIAAFGDEQLNKSFDNLSLKYGLFWKCLREGQLGKAFDEKLEAQLCAGVIFDRIKPQLRKQ